MLQQLAEALWSRHAGQLHRVAVVLPGRRAGLHLQKYLAAIAGRSFWAPDLIDPGTFMERLSGRRQADTTELLFLLYEVHREQSGVHADPLATFMQWAPVALRDISEVDAHLLDLDDLYRDLRSYHEIEEWSLRLGGQSPAQKRLAQQWRHTGNLHRGLLERMEARGIGTSGSLARHVAGKAAAGTLELPWDMVWFAGANAMEPAMLAVARHLQQVGKAEFAWDADRFYLDDRTQEAGEFLRRAMAALGPGIVPPANLIRTKERAFTTVAVNGRVAQARHAAALLRALDPDQRAATTVVLADESLLMPLLEALPGTIGPLNVTMGVPLTALPVHGLIEALLRVHDHGTGRGPLLEDVERLLLHPFLPQGPATTAAIRALRETGQSRPTTHQVEQALREARLAGLDALGKALAPMPVADAPGIMTRVEALIAHASALRLDDPMVQEQLFRMARAQQQLHQGLEHAGALDIDLQSYAAIRTRVLRAERIPFTGEPLQGLQIMGMLETRAIAMDRVLVLGANEGHLPPEADVQSWIPFAIRHAKGLPMPGHAAMISAYHFQRLAQHASEITLVYDASEEASDPSRFIAQWQREVVGLTATQGRHASVGVGFTLHPRPVVHVAPSAATTAKITAILERGLSPSALGTWCNCPLDFLFRFVLGVEPLDSPDGKLGSDVLGTAVHGVMEELYRPWLGRAIDPTALSSGTDLRQAVHDRLLSDYPAHVLAEGHFKLRIEMAAQAMDRYLQAEMERLLREATVPLYLEHEVSAALSDQVRFKGRCDRVETRSGVHHILDLKTGSTDPRALVLPDLDRASLGPDQRYALQLLIYAWCYLEQHPEVDAVRAGIVPLKRSSQADGLFLKIAGEDLLRRSLMPDVAALLQALVDELRDPTAPFVHRAESIHCSCCVPMA